MAVLLFLAILGFLVVAHELGHLTAAKAAGVRVLEFGVGFPPKLLGFRWRGTDYRLNLLPLGGYVRMLGEDEAQDSSDPAAFANASAPRRLAILAAGAAVNAVLPVFLLTAVLALPQDVATADVVVTRVAPGSPAASADVQVGDVVREADGRRIDHSVSLQQAIHLRLGAESAWLMEREGERREARLIPRVDPPPGEGAAGVEIANARVSAASVERGSAAASAGLQAGDTLVLVRAGGASDQALTAADADAALAAASGLEDAEALVLRRGRLITLSLAGAGALDGAAWAERPPESRRLPLWSAFVGSFQWMGDILVAFRNELSRVAAGTTPLQVAGPVGIAQLTGEVATGGSRSLVVWTALLSMNLAIVNLLPLPALDGGRIAFVLVELARGGRRLAPDKERLAHMAGFAVLMAGVLLISVNDIRRLLGD